MSTFFLSVIYSLIFLLVACEAVPAARDAAGGRDG